MSQISAENVSKSPLVVSGDKGDPPPDGGSKIKPPTVTDSPETPIDVPPSGDPETPGSSEETS